MPRQGPRRLPAGERDRRLAEEVLYLHSLWRRGGPAPVPAPIQPRSDRREEPKSLWGRLDRALRRKERKLAVKPAFAPPPPASSRGTLAEAGGASAPPAANPPPPATTPGPLAQRDAVPSNRDPVDVDGEGFDSDVEKAEEQEAAAYFTGLFERDAWLRGHYTGRWRKGRFQCMVCAAGGSGKVEKAVRRFRGCLALINHARDTSRGHSLGRGGRRGAHRALAAVVCRLLGWDIEKVAPMPRPRVVTDPRTTAGFQHAKENDGAGEDNGNSTDDDSYSIDEDEESDDEESVDEEEDIMTGIPDPATDSDEEDSEIESNEEYAEKDIEIGMPDPATDSDEEDSDIESNEEYAEREDADAGTEGSRITGGGTEPIELDNSEKIPEKGAANSIARKRDMKIRDRLLSLTHAKPVDTTLEKTEVWKSSHVPKRKKILIPGIKFNEGSDKAKRKASALSYQGLKSSISCVVKKVKVNHQPSTKGKQSKTNETGASARKAKRPAVAARKAKLLAQKELAKKLLAKKAQDGCLNHENTHRSSPRK